MHKTIDFTVNGTPVRVDTDGATPLLSVLREELRLRGTKFGCGTEQCGSCMVLIDGEPAYSCTRAVESRRRQGGDDGRGPVAQRHTQHLLQQAFLDEQAGQCGYCLSGILISASALLERNPKPSRAEIIGRARPASLPLRHS